MKNILCIMMLLFCSSITSGFAATEVTVHGRITDVDGLAVSGAEVGVYRGENVKKPADFVSNRTTADGKYRVTLPAGNYWAVAVFRKDGRRFGPLGTGDKQSALAVEVSVEPDGDLELDFKVMDLREAARSASKKSADLFLVSGRLLNRKGTPVRMAYAMADLAARFKDVPRYLSAWSDSSGIYSLFLPKGRYYIGGSTGFPPDSAYTLPKVITIDQDSTVDIVILD